MLLKKPFCLIFSLIVFFWLSQSLYADDNIQSIVDKKIEEALLLYDMGKVDVAIYKLQLIYEENPRNAAILMKLSELAVASRNWAYAIQTLEGVAAIRPDDIHVRVILMDIYKAYQMPIQEIKTGRDIIKIEPGNLDILERLARLYHEQSMYVEEEETRLIIADLDVSNYENLKILAFFYADEGEVWEEIIIRERIHTFFPQDIANKKRLVFLYNEDKKLFQKLSVLREILWGTGSVSEELKSEYYQTYTDYKKSLLLFDKITSTTYAQFSDTYDNSLLAGTENFQYKMIFLDSFSSLDFDLSYSDIFNLPKLNKEKNYHVGKIDSSLKYKISSFNSKMMFSMLAGVNSIFLYDIGDTITYRIYSIDFFTLRLIDHIKIFPFAELDFLTEISRPLYLNLYFRSSLIEEIESYLNPLRNNEAGMNLSLLFPDGTTISSGFEFHWIWQEVIRYRVAAELIFPLFTTGEVYDYKRNRVGYLKDIPDTQIDFHYAFEFFNNAHLCPFYSEVDLKHTHTVILVLHQKISDPIVFYIECLGELSNTFDYSTGGTLGLENMNPESNITFSLNLFYKYQNILPLPGKDIGKPRHDVGLNFQISIDLK